MSMAAKPLGPSDYVLTNDNDEMTTGSGAEQPTGTPAAGGPEAFLWRFQVLDLYQVVLLGETPARRGHAFRMTILDTGDDELAPGSDIRVVVQDPILAEKAEIYRGQYRRFSAATNQFDANETESLKNGARVPQSWHVTVLGTVPAGAVNAEADNVGSFVSIDVIRRLINR